MTAAGADWRAVGGVTTSWFDAPSSVAAAALAGEVVELAPGAAVDVRDTGVRVRLDSPEPAEAVSAAARARGLTTDPTVLQHLGVVLKGDDLPAVRRFWQQVLGYDVGDAGDLVDPLRRDPAVGLQQSAQSRPLRNRVHLDVVRPTAVVEGVAPGEPSGPYGVRHVDPEGNEVDLVPGDVLGDGAGTSDWHTVFSAVACYRTTSTEQQRALSAAAAALADVGFPLLIDLRPGLVVLDSGKDRWEADAHGLDLEFTDLAARLQTAARTTGAVADPSLPRFVQLFLDAADVAALRAFWLAALCYDPDRRHGASDVHDPRRLDPTLVFQELDASETERRRQHNRLRLELSVPSDAVESRLATLVAAGGRLLGESADRYRVADPEGNELQVVGG